MVYEAGSSFFSKEVTPRGIFRSESFSSFLVTSVRSSSGCGVGQAVLPSNDTLYILEEEDDRRSNAGSRGWGRRVAVELLPLSGPLRMCVPDESD